MKMIMRNYVVMIRIIMVKIVIVRLFVMITTK